MARILVVDDEAMIRLTLKEALCDNHDIDEASDGREALERLTAAEYDLVISDIYMPNLDGLGLLAEARKVRPELCIIMMTSKPTIESAQKALREGAFDYVIKDSLLADTLAAVNRAMERTRLRREVKLLHEALHDKFSFDRIIGKSPQMQKVFETIRKVLFTDTTVLILGDTGAGKELVAKAIHFNGKRRDKSYVAVNCAAISPHLLESELFGHERGAFTGAVTSKKGLFEEADGGTIFLDEVSEMAKDLQSKLLRVLQEREVQRVGATKPHKIDVRVLAASNRDLAYDVDADRFRPDLYYRLNVVPIPLPPLREREGDVGFLAQHFLDLHCRRQGCAMKRLDAAALELLSAYAWPGNVRELENEIERAVSLVEGEALGAETFAHLGKGGRRSPVGHAAAPVPSDEGASRSLSQMEEDHIRRVLDGCEGNKSKAAKILDIDYSTLLRKLKRMGLEVEG